jgi:hypothetical protein
MKVIGTNIMSSMDRGDAAARYLKFRDNRRDLLRETGSLNSLTF